MLAHSHSASFAVVLDSVPVDGAGLGSRRVRVTIEPLDSRLFFSIFSDKLAAVGAPLALLPRLRSKGLFAEWARPLGTVATLI